MNPSRSSIFGEGNVPLGKRVLSGSLPVSQPDRLSPCSSWSTTHLASNSRQTTFLTLNHSQLFTHSTQSILNSLTHSLFSSPSFPVFRGVGGRVYVLLKLILPYVTTRGNERDPPGKLTTTQLLHTTLDGSRQKL